MKEQSKSVLVAFTLGLFAGLPLAVSGQAPEPQPDPVVIEEVLELNEAVQAEPPPGSQPPEVEPDGDGFFSDKEREEAAVAALTDPRAEAPDQILFEPESPPPPPGTEGPIGDAAAIVRSFAGIDSPTSGSQIPDPSLARSPNRVLLATNGMLRLARTDGSTLAQMSMDAFFGLSGLARGTTDPKVYFDALGSNKVFVLAVMGKGTPKRLHLAVSRLADPDNLAAPASWCRYSLPHPASVPQALADYPNLGAGPEHLILTSNHFESGGGGGTLVRLIAKSVLYNSTQPCQLTVASTAVFPPTSDFTRANLRTLQPVRFSTAPGSAGGVTTLGYLVSAIEYRSSGYRVWSLQRNSAGNLITPLKSKEVQASKIYLEPPPASQPATFPGGVNTLNTGDGRILQAVGTGNTIWFTQTTGCNNSGTGVNESCANAMQLNVVPGAGNPGVTFGQEAMLGAGTGVSVWMPSIAMTPTGHVALMYHQGSSNLSLSLGVAVKRASTMNFKVLPLEKGLCSRTGSQIRTGDYLGAQVDPSGTSFWLAGEKLIYIGMPIPQNCRWATYVKEVRP